MWRTTGEAESAGTAGGGRNDTAGPHPEKDDGRLIFPRGSAFYGAR